MSQINSISIAQIPLPAILISHFGKIEDVNELGELFTGYLKTTLIGKPVEILTGEYLNTQHIKVLSRSKNENPHRRQYLG